MIRNTLLNMVGDWEHQLMHLATMRYNSGAYKQGRPPLLRLVYFGPPWIKGAEVDEGAKVEERDLIYFGTLVYFGTPDRRRESVREVVRLYPPV